ncbi:hypothetical protein [Hirschia litorea]|uniref:Tetratricopeptide repeat-containing protein n=1 Tax=Hirschia litorea TaxID=1199156 RepID=A0ABW2IJK3_9PROT
MFGLFNGGKKRSLKCANWHPDMDAALNHMDKGNWSGLSQLLAKQTNNGQYALIQACGVNGELGQFNMDFPPTSDADIFVGGIRTQWAWRYRGGATGDRVGLDAGLMFFNELEAATEYLDRALEAKPHNPLAIGFKIRVAMGEGNREERDALIARLIQCDDPPLEALGVALQSLCPKWGGSLEKVFAFARDVAQCDNIHPARQALLARAHIEVWLNAMMDDEASIRSEYQNYLTRDEVFQEILAANTRFEMLMEQNARAQKDVFATQFAHNNFGYAFYRAGQFEGAAKHIDALKNAPAETPWGYSFAKDIQDQWPKLRKQVGLSKNIPSE